MPFSGHSFHSPKSFFTVILSAFLIFGLTASAWGLPDRTPPALRAAFQDVGRRAPLGFEPNLGQAHPDVRYLTRGPGYSLFLTDSEAVMSLTAPGPDAAPRVVRLTLTNGRSDVVGENPLLGRVNYFRGSGPAGWKTNVPTYSRVRYREAHPGVDLVFYSRDRKLEFDIEAAPEADLSQVRLKYEGVKSLEVDRRGDLVLELPGGGRVIQRRPVVFQEIAGRRVRLEGRHVLFGRNQVGFAVPNRDRRRAVIIDPVLLYSTYIGDGGSNESIAGVRVTSGGLAVIAGTVTNNDYPVKNQIMTAQGLRDAYVSVFDPEAAGASSLVYSTYIGGENNDYGNGLDLDHLDNIYITGRTDSSSYPTVNQYQTDQTNVDGYLTRIKADGSAIEYSTYVGGDLYDHANGVAADGLGKAYVTGETYGGTFPILNPTQTGGFGGGNHDAYVTVFDTEAAGAGSLYFSTYLGGSGDDAGKAIAVDDLGHAYLTGDTLSTDFPLANQFQTYPSGSGSNGFLTKIDPQTGGAPGFLYSTYLAGSAYEAGMDVAVDSAGNAYVTGTTDSADFPVKNAFQDTKDPANSDAYLVKIAPSQVAAASLVYSTFFGGNGLEDTYGVAVDAEGNAYITGASQSTDLVMVNPYKATKNASSDVFVAKLDPTLGTDGLLFSTYLGGNGNDLTYGLAVGDGGRIFLAGRTGSTDFPVKNEFSNTRNGTMDQMVTVFDLDGPKVVDADPADGDAGVPVNTTVWAKFSEDLDQSTISATTFTLDNGVTGAVTYSAANRTATFTPSADLQPGTQYTATIKDAVKDLNGLNMAADHVWSFTTAAAAAPAAAAATTTPAGTMTHTITFSGSDRARDFVIVSVPFEPGTTRRAQIMGAPLPPYNPFNMRIGYWDPDRQAYDEFPFDAPPCLGWAGWFLFRDNTTLTFSGAETTTAQDPLGRDAASCRLASGWNQVGNPFPFPIDVSEIVVEEEDGRVEYLLNASNDITQQRFWVFNGGVYKAGSILGTAEGGWLKKLTPGEGRVYFLNAQAAASADLRPDLSNDELEQPPAPPAGLDPSSGPGGGGGDGGGCFIASTLLE